MVTPSLPLPGDFGRGGMEFEWRSNSFEENPLFEGRLLNFVHFTSFVPRSGDSRECAGFGLQADPVILHVIRSGGMRFSAAFRGLFFDVRVEPTRLSRCSLLSAVTAWSDCSANRDRPLFSRVALTSPRR
jgi:hypothetical protein